MKSVHQLKILGIALVGFTLFSMIYYSTDVLDSLRVFMLYNLVPMDLVFDEGIDLKQYDGGVILNCLRDKNFCPEGVHYKDDVSGEVFPSNPNQPKTFQPYTPTPELNPAPHPDSVKTQVDQLDNASYVFYGMAILALIIVLVGIILWKRKTR